jgi:molybdopterin synthase sulfur carrier subunit
MTISMLYFAWVRERIGTGEEQVDPPEAVRNVADLIDWLAQQSVPLDALLGSAREVAIFPPVTGG